MKRRLAEEVRTVTEATVTQLIKKAQKGDVRAFEQVVEQYYIKIYNIALGYMGNPHDAEDAAQNALIKIHNSIGGFRFKSKFSTWVYRITVNACTDQLRRKKGGDVSSEDLSEANLGADSRTPEDHAMEQEAVSVLRKAVSSLKEEHKTVIILRDINGFSYGEIARLTGCSEGTVKSRISRARAALKAALIEDGYFK